MLPHLKVRASRDWLLTPYIPRAIDMRLLWHGVNYKKAYIPDLKDWVLRLMDKSMIVKFGKRRRAATHHKRFFTPKGA
jgi:hypothetical protein